MSETTEYKPYQSKRIDKLAQGNYNTLMMNFITENWGTLVVGIILIIIVVLAILKIIKDRKSGKSSCGGNCSCCNMPCKSRQNDETCPK